MKRLSFVIITSISIICFSYNLQAQPKFIVHIIGGYSQPLSDLKGSIPAFDTTQNSKANYPFQMKNGFNFGADGKLALGKKGNIRLVFGLNYNVFKNSADMPDIYYPSETVTFNSKVNILGLTLGGEYAFLPKKNVNPFIGFDLTGNFWSGSFSWDNSGDSAAYTILSLKSAARFGIQFGGGVDFKLGKQEGLVVGFKYNFANLAGKGYTDPLSFSTSEISLNDKASGVNPARNLNYLQFYIGISMFLGQSKKK
jgi:hypothetical protein